MYYYVPIQVSDLWRSQSFFCFLFLYTSTNTEKIQSILRPSSFYEFLKRHLDGPLTLLLRWWIESRGFKQAFRGPHATQHHALCGSRRCLKRANLHLMRGLFDPRGPFKTFRFASPDIKGSFFQLYFNFDSTHTHTFTHTHTHIQICQIQLKINLCLQLNETIEAKFQQEKLK
jgi:hypothetical protein